jgi:hypothetical protein
LLTAWHELTPAGGPGNRFLEAAVNVHMFPFLTRKSLWSLRGKASSAIIQIAGTIEARSDEEMPERIVFTGKLLNIVGFAGPHLSDAAVGWLQRESEARGHNRIVQAAGADHKDKA